MHELRVLLLAAFLAAPAAFAQSADLHGAPGGPFVVNGVDTIVFFEHVDNEGPDTASNVTFTMNTPPFTRLVGAQSTGLQFFACTAPPSGGTGLITCTAPSQPAGVNGLIEVILRIDGGTPSGTIITSQYTISSTTPDPDPADNVIVQNTNVQWNVVNRPTAALSVTKNGPPAGTPGGVLDYTMTLTNNGPDSASSVTFRDTTPANTTALTFQQTSGLPMSCTPTPPGTIGTSQCTADAFPVGTATFAMSVTVQGAAAGTTVTNTANVTSSTFQFNTADDSASTSAEISAVVIPADIAVTVDATPTAVARTGVISYFATVRNIGGLPASPVQFSFPIPAQTTFYSGSAPGVLSCSFPSPGASSGALVCTAATMAPGAQHTFNFEVQPNANVAHGTVITGTAVVTTPTVESSTANNTASDTTTISNVADLFAHATPVSGGYPFNTNVGITFDVRNIGPQHSLGATLSIPLPAGVTFVSVQAPQGTSCSGTTTVTCDLGALGVGARPLVVLSVRPTQTGPLSITGTIAGNPAQHDPQGNNTTTFATDILAPPVAAKSFQPSTIAPNGITRLTITVTNPNNVEIFGVGVFDVYPAGLTNFGSPEAQSTCGGSVSASPGGNQLVFSNGRIPANGTCTVSALVRGTGTQPIVNELPAGSVTTANAGSSGAPASAALAFGAVATPTLSEWGLIALAALLALFAARAIR